MNNHLKKQRITMKTMMANRERYLCPYTAVFA